MSAVELLTKLSALGIKLAARDGELKIIAPPGTLTSELRDELLEAKTELLELLNVAAESAVSGTTKIPRADRNKVIPLSSGQQRMWFLEEFEGGTTVYNIPWAMRIKGDLNTAAMEQAFCDLIARHESLRTRFRTNDGKPYQDIVASLPLQIERETMPGAADAQIQARLESLSRHVFDLSVGPLLKVNLIKLGAQDQILSIVMHHIVSDAWSLDVLSREVMTCYIAHANGDTPKLAELPIQFADYAVWQRNNLVGAERDRQLAYWKEKLRGAPALLELPTDHPRPSEQSYRGARRRRFMPIKLQGQLKQLARNHNGTLFMVLLSAFNVLLSRYTRQDDIVVGTPIAGRKYTELEVLIGLFLNTLVMRSNLSDDPTFNDLLRQVQETSLEAFANQDIPFEQLVDDLAPARDMSYSPVFQVLFMLQNAPMSSEPLPGLEIQPVEFDYGTAKFDLTLATAETPDGLVAEIEYSTDLFDADTIARMLEHYENLLYAIADNPDSPVSQLPMLSEAEKHKVIADWNDTQVDYPTGVTLKSLLEAQADKTPEAPALVFADTQLTYASLNARANQLAHWLLTEGVTADTLVGVCMERSIEMVVALLGIIKAGGAYVPLDPEYPQQRLQHMLEDADIPLLLTQELMQASLPEHSAKTLCVDTAATLLDAQPTDNPSVSVSADSLAYVIFTSGSTGRPKGVMNEHRGICNRLLWMQQEYQLNTDDTVLQKTPFSFDVSVWEFFWPLITGARLVVAQPGGHKDSDYLTTIINEQQITTLHFVPSMLQVFLQNPAASACTTLRRVICSGEALSHDLQKRFYAEFGDAELHNLYGPTEAAIDVSYWACPREGGTGIVPIGRPVANTQIYIVDAYSNPVPVGVPGELLIGGVQVARGYVNRPELTTEHFASDPFSVDPAARIYRTGDLVRFLNDGNIEFLGRIDHQIKLRGFRIELGEIEATLDGLTGIEQSLVMLREDAPGDKRLVAYIMGNDAGIPDIPDLRRELQCQLPEYMVPAAFVSLDKFPLLPNGKVDRAALPEPDSSRALDNTYTPPRDLIETQLADIWAELLRIERVGVHDNFFELGGDSILSIQIITRAAKADLVLTPKQVFQHQTVAELAQVVGTTARLEAEQGPVSGDVILTPIQRWFFANPSPQEHYFNQSLLLELAEHADGNNLQQALAHLVTHHDALRLRFTKTDSGWQQSLDALSNSILLKHNLDAHSGATIDEQLFDAASSAQSEIDLNGGCLLQARLFESAATDQQYLLIAIHHLAIDGLSWRVLLEDLETVYTQIKQGDTPALPRKTSSFKSWAEHLDSYAHSEELLDELNYWRRQCTPIASLAPDKTTGANDVASAHTLNLSLDEDTTRRLLQDVPSAYHTQINDVLLTALARALSNWTHATSVLIDLEGHGREEIFTDLDVSRTVGWFTSLFPVRLTADHADIGAALKAVKEQLRSIPNRGLSYGVLRYLNTSPEVTEVMNAIPVSQVIFNYLGQFDQTFTNEGAFRLSDKPRGFEQGADRRRTHLLEINSSVYAGQLQIGVTYSANRHDEATVQAFADDFNNELINLIAYCTTAGNTGFTPSDFPLAKLTQIDVDRLTGGDQEVADIYPVTPMQHGLLFHTIHQQDGAAYLTQVNWELKGEIDAGIFEKAWQMICDRHASLRTGIFDVNETTPLQVVYQVASIKLNFNDWRSKSPEKFQSALQQFLDKEGSTPFDLQKPPLIRINLFRRDDDHYQFIWCYHHIIMDGWSIPIVIGEVLQAYNALSEGKSPDLTDERPYRDYVAWLAGQHSEAAQAFWTKYLQNLIDPTALPAISAHDPGHQQGDYASHSIKLDSAATTVIKEFTRSERLTLNTLAQGVWALLLNRYNRDTDVVFGATSSGRPPALKNVESMVGLFLNTLPVYTKITSGTPVKSWLAELQEQQLTARQYEYASLVEIQGWSAVPRGIPLFNSLLVFENYPEVSSLWASGNQTLSITDMRALEWTNYPLTVVVAIGREFNLRLDYDRKHYDKATIEKLAVHFKTLLNSIVAHPDCAIDQLVMLAEDERSQLVTEWNRTKAEYPRDTSLHALITRQATVNSDAIAVICGDQQLKYGELETRSNQLAHRLIELGADRDVPIALCMDRSIDMLVGLLGILKAGSAYVPLDPDFPPDRLRYMLEDSEAPVIVTQSSQTGLIEGLDIQAVCLDQPDPVSKRPDTLPAVDVASDQLAYIIYTSGSTGKPKGVAIEHRAVINFIFSMLREPGITRSDRLLAVTTLSFDISILEIFGPLMAGATTVLAPKTVAIDGFALAHSLEHDDITIMQATPATWRMLIQTGWQGKSGLKILCGGEALDAGLAAQLVGCGTELWNMYGPTETTIWSACTRIHAEDSLITVGNPIANTRCYILDDQHQPVPLGVAGELFIGGDGVAREYLNRPELTAEKFMTDPFVSDERMYSTGDLARYRPNGQIEILGRTDFQVKLRGFRIELGEIESALTELDSIAQCVTVLREDTPGDQRLVAYVTASDAAPIPDNDALRAHLRAGLPDYMVPAAFMQLDNFPLTPNGKVNRKQLPPPEWHAQEDYVAPDNKLEEAFVTIWQDVLGLEQVGVSDDFFELGGHSLLTLRLIKDIQIATGQQLTIADIFDNPTISELVTVIPTDAIITLPNETNKSLSSSTSWLARLMSMFGTKKS